MRDERQLQHPIEIREIGLARFGDHPVVRVLALQLYLVERTARKEEVIFAVLLHPAGVRVDRTQIRVSRRSFHGVHDVFLHRARHIEAAPRRELLAHPIHFAERGSRDAEFRKFVAVLILHEDFIFASLLLAVVVDDLAGDARREVAELHEHFSVLGLLRKTEAVILDEIRLRVELRQLRIRRFLILRLLIRRLDLVGVVHPIQRRDELCVGHFLRRLFVFHDRFDGVVLAEMEVRLHLGPRDIPFGKYDCVFLICHTDSFPTLRSCLMFRFAYRLFSATIVITFLSAAGLDLYFGFC